MAERSAPVVNVEGERAALGPLRRDLFPVYQRWNNDAATNRTTASFRPTTLEQETSAFDAVTADPSYALFTVYERGSWRAVGMTYLTKIDHRNRRAEFGIVIGEADCRGRGFGTETTRLMLDYAFTALGLHSVMLTCAEFNAAGRRAYEKAGFREVGRRRQCRWLAGRLWDDIYMDCLATEFRSPVLVHVFAANQLRP